MADKIHLLGAEVTVHYYDADHDGKLWIYPSDPGNEHVAARMAADGELPTY